MGGAPTLGGGQMAPRGSRGRWQGISLGGFHADEREQGKGGAQLHLVAEAARW
jgi:hypothetical protein